jgi:hypothetical protein
MFRHLPTFEIQRASVSACALREGSCAIDEELRRRPKPVFVGAHGRSREWRSDMAAQAAEA